MHDYISLGVNELSSLRTDGLDHLRMSVTGVGHADATGKVEIFLSVYSIEVTTLSALGLDRKDARPYGGHVRIIFFEESHNAPASGYE
jgi:hypothetical protein